ncbi:hypothetical protein [Nocardia iowensis]|uniref:ESX-1 secretion-associated protein n=1 Tax=Nocardia iowensis TaxID=204891 RepID=A0ABX8RNG5_NOCIO|nr:hypothetical protein [Nocardia iowensis]QXN90537.1 hypothetical protein KV110_34960 [Nocardia iowensis]
MSGDEIVIKPEHVHSSGGAIETEAREARAALGPLFDSAQPAADGNKGFATGPKLVAYANSMKAEVEGTINEFATTAQQIVAAAQSMQAMDVDNATGVSRIATALNGLGQPPPR